ncbi:MAG: hypothetical protein ACI4HZ_03550 [Ruminococcus sp.]
MKNTFRFSNRLFYSKVLISLILVITMVTSSLPIAYAVTTHTGVLSNTDFESGTDSWSKADGEITVKDGEGVESTKALELTEDNNAVYQAYTKSDGEDFFQGTTFEWNLKYKSTGSSDIGAIVLGTNLPTATAEQNDQLRQMMTWLKEKRKIDQNKNFPANGQYTVVVYSRPFDEEGGFVVEEKDDFKDKFSLVPTIYCKEKFTVTLFRTTGTEWQTVDNSDNTKFTFNESFQSLYYSLISYSGNPIVDDVDLTVVEPDKQDAVYNNLRNGGFEEPNVREYLANKNLKDNFYASPHQDDVPDWKTTAKDNKIELFDDNDNKNSAHFIFGTKEVYRGKQSGELNAEQPSTLYQYINTESGSKYKWSLAHRGRRGADIMALIIGPKQYKENSKDAVELKKTAKDSKDHFMQMVEWIKGHKVDFGTEIAEQINKLTDNSDAGVYKLNSVKLDPVKVTVYSRRFADNGKFVDGTDDNFSATESTVFSQKWDVTIICSGNTRWYEYGLNEEDYSFYNVPEGQDESIFAFTGYLGTPGQEGQDPALSTYGNLLDEVNFELYYPARSVSYTGGVAELNYVYKGEPKKVSLGSGESTDSLWIDDNSTFTLDVTPDYATITNENGEQVPRLDANNKPIQNAFLGAYITIGGKREYYPATAVNAEDKAVYFSETVGDDGKITYSYGKSNVSGRIVVELVFSEVYTMTYNSKGGAPYSVHSGSYTPNNSMDWSGSNANIARFYERFPCTYTSTACEWWEDNPGVRFKGWELVGGEIYEIESDGTKTLLTDTKGVLFAGDAKVEHSVNDDENVFIITDKNNKYEGRVDAQIGGVLVANWEYKTSVIAQTEQLDGSFINSDVGGEVSLTGHTTAITDDAGKVYNTDEGIGSCAEFTYLSPFNNNITVSGNANEHYTFYGWFDQDGNKLSSITDHIYTVEPYYSESEKATRKQTPSVIYARFGISTKVKFHINDSETVSTVGNPDADLYRVYYPSTVTIPDEDKSVTNELGITHTIHNLEENNTIHYFYDIPTPKSDNGKIFKGWYRDPDNDSDNYPIQWDLQEFEGERNVYAHWIDVGTMNKDAQDSKIIHQSTVGSNLLPGIDLLGVQIRYEEEDPNYPGGREDTPHFDTDGLRFITCIKEDILSKTNSLFKTKYGSYTKKNLSYGYVIAKEATANDNLSAGETLEYNDANVNGVDTTAKYSFAKNIDCTSSVGGYKNTTIVDHKNYKDYRIYSLVIAYNTAGKTDKEIESAKTQNVIARPYLRYQDANGLYRTYYQDYQGTKVYGGCSTNYNVTKDYLSENNYFPKSEN